LSLSQWSKSEQWPKLPEVFGPVFFQPDPERSKAINLFGNELLAMNQDAVNQRYGEHDAPPPYEPGPCILNLTPIQAYTSIECYLYQCSEGDVPERRLYQSLVGYRDALAHCIVQALPQYRNAEWA